MIGLASMNLRDRNSGRVQENHDGHGTSTHQSAHDACVGASWVEVKYKSCIKMEHKLEAFRACIERKALVASKKRKKLSLSQVTPRVYSKYKPCT